MTRNEKKQLLRKQIIRIEELLYERQPAMSFEAQCIVCWLNRRRTRKKEMLMVLSFPNGN